MILDALHLTLFEFLRALGTVTFIALFCILLAYAEPQPDAETSDPQPDLEHHQGKTRIGLDHPLRVIGGARKD